MLFFEFLFTRSGNRQLRIICKYNEIAFNCSHMTKIHNIRSMWHCKFLAIQLLPDFIRFHIRLIDFLNRIYIHTPCFSLQIKNFIISHSVIICPNLKTELLIDILKIWFNLIKKLIYFFENIICMRLIFANGWS